MNKPVFSWFTVAVLMSCNVFLASAVEPVPQTQPAAAATVSAGAAKLPFATPLKWKSTGVLIRPVSDETHQSQAAALCNMLTLRFSGEKQVQKADKKPCERTK